MNIRPGGRAERGVVAVACAVMLAGAAGCGASLRIPSDPEGTLDRAEHGYLVVGVSVHPPWTQVGADGVIRGREADLVRGYADSIDADVRWTVAPESVLVQAASDGDVDIVIGGLTASSLTRGYEKADATGSGTEEMVMGVRMGENRLMMSLEKYLAQEAGELS